MFKGLGNGKISLLDLFSGKYPRVISPMFKESKACSEKVLPVVFFTIWLAVVDTAACINDDAVKPEVAGPRNAKGTI